MKTLAVMASSGVRTALGLTALQTAFLLRTGVTAIGAAPLCDADGEPITACFDPTLHPHLVGDERAAKIAQFALYEVFAPLGDMAQSLSMRLLLCLDERYGQSAASAAMLAAKVHAKAREMCPNITLEIFARGAASAAFALPKALEALAARQVDAVLLGGVHSDYEPRWIARLLDAGQLFRPDNVDAVLPGEAAAFVLLTRDDVVKRANLAVRARLHDIGVGVERATVNNDVSAYEASGLTAAVRAATDDLRKDGLKIGWSLNDCMFETRRLAEWHTVLLRAGEAFGEPHEVQSPAQRLGNMGAAALPLLVALAMEGWRRGYARSNIALAYAGSDAGERGALLLSAGNPTDPG